MDAATDKGAAGSSVEALRSSSTGDRVRRDADKPASGTYWAVLAPRGTQTPAPAGSRGTAPCPVANGGQLQNLSVAHAAPALAIHADTQLPSLMGARPHAPGRCSTACFRARGTTRRCAGLEARRGAADTARADERELQSVASRTRSKAQACVERGSQTGERGNAKRAISARLHRASQPPPAPPCAPGRSA